MANALNYGSTLTWTDNLAAAGAVAGRSSVQYSGYNTSGTLNSDTVSPAVPISKRAYFQQALTAGAATIDLTDLTHVQADATETVDGSSLKVQFLRLEAPSTNTAVITVTPGASNPYNLVGSAFEIEILPGQVVYLELNESAPDISASACEMDLAGTGTEALNCSIVMG